MEWVWLVLQTWKSHHLRSKPGFVGSKTDGGFLWDENDVYFVVDFCGKRFVDIPFVPWILWGFGKRKNIKTSRDDLQTFCGRVGREGKEDFWYVFCSRRIGMKVYMWSGCIALFVLRDVLLSFMFVWREHHLDGKFRWFSGLYMLERNDNDNINIDRNLSPPRKDGLMCPLYPFVPSFGVNIFHERHDAVLTVFNLPKTNEEQKHQAAPYRMERSPSKVIFISEGTLNFPKFSYNFW